MSTVMMYRTLGMIMCGVAGYVSYKLAGFEGVACVILAEFGVTLLHVARFEETVNNFKEKE